mmetsp:Transcript_12928/g.40801  ORF Transcript_12928/g.40801 Transcript_12928/m.40801 type:complete len:217 (-) Transcript_12928:1054-1704(-)
MSELEASKMQQQIGLLRLMYGLFKDPGDVVLHKRNYQQVRGILLSAASFGFLVVAYMAISTGLITFNKYLLHEGRFPYVIFIGMLHMSCSLLCNLVLYWMCPSLFPSLTDPEQQVRVDRPLILQVLLPIAGCFGAQLVLSNMAFMHSSLAFLQMMKQSNVVLVYLFSLALHSSASAGGEPSSSSGSSRPRASPSMGSSTSRPAASRSRGPACCARA